MTTPAKNPFVKLSDDVTLATTSSRVVETEQVGRVIGFGCNSAEEEAFESLRDFVQSNRVPADTAQTDSNFDDKVKELVDTLGEAIIADQKSR